MYPALFYLFSTLTLLPAVGVVCARSLVRASVSLLFTLAGVAGLYFLLNAEFLAAVQLVVYTGGILTLIIFGVMLTSTSIFHRFKPQPVEIVLAGVMSLVLITTLVLLITRSHFLSSMDPLPREGTVPLIGQALLGDMLVPFELSSVLLLVVMIGAAYLARGRRPHEDQDRG